LTDFHLQGEKTPSFLKNLQSLPGTTTTTATMKDHVSERGSSFIPKKPGFFDVLDDIWDKESNPGGIVNLGLAENVSLP